MLQTEMWCHVNYSLSIPFHEEASIIEVYTPKDTSPENSYSLPNCCTHEPWPVSAMYIKYGTCTSFMLCFLYSRSGGPGKIVRTLIASTGKAPKPHKLMRINSQGSTVVYGIHHSTPRIRGRHCTVSILLLYLGWSDWRVTDTESPCRWTFHGAYIFHVQV